MNEAAALWADARLIYAVAGTAVALLVVTVWLFRRRKRQGRQAALICLALSLLLHLVLLMLVPVLPNLYQGGLNVGEQPEGVVPEVEFSTFDPDAAFEDVASSQTEPAITPLPVANLTDLLQPEAAGDNEANAEVKSAAESAVVSESEQAETTPQPLDEPEKTTLATNPPSMTQIEQAFSEMLDAALVEEAPREPIVRTITDNPTIPTPESDVAQTHPVESPPPDVASIPFDAPVPSDGPIDAEPIAANVNPASEPSGSTAEPKNPNSTAASRGTTAHPASAAVAKSANVAGSLKRDFANRNGASKQHALQQTGGDEQTEAAVEAALRFLADAQRADGAWDPRASAAGIERRPLGISRGGAGSRAETALTGLALLAFMGAGNTHQQGPYAENVYRGLAYLIRTQKPDGSLAGEATINAATYCHGMAALAMCEAAVMTGDPSAIQCSRRAVAYTIRIQHPSTGGWRYSPGDPGDLSQLGWQAMVLDAAHRAGIEIAPKAVVGVQRFLRRVRMGTYGGLATYRQGEGPSRTMTAEALATRLLIGEQVPVNEIAEAERYLLQQLPGVGKDNYYYWYYATLALHQLQDDAWQRWNQALKTRLLQTQRPDGGFSSETLWGGYGGTVYTTSMAALCLETYYRHAIRGEDQRVATQPSLRR